MRAYVRVLLPALIAIGCLHAAPVRAQQQELPRRRSGYYLALGLSGLMNQAWQDDGPDRLGGGTAFGLRFGQMVTKQFGLGLRLSSGGARSGVLQSTQILLGLEAQWEFARNFALRAGAGLGVASVKDTSDRDAKLKGTVGGGYSIALSYDWFPARSEGSGGFAITPVLEARLVPGTKISALSGLVGVEFSYWTGLSRDELVLPEDQAYKPR